jgi:hypothetical protein
MTLGLFLGITGCGGKVPTAAELQQAVTDGVNSAVKSGTQAVEQAKQVANLAGQIELSLGPGIKTGGCYARLDALQAPRNGWLVISSYSDPAGETFPSVMILVETTGETAATLAGKNFRAAIFLQLQAEGAVWRTPDGEFAELTIVTAADGKIEGKITRATLVSTGAEPPASVTGQFSGSLQ